MVHREPILGAVGLEASDDEIVGAHLGDLEVEVERESVSGGVEVFVREPLDDLNRSVCLGVGGELGAERTQAAGRGRGVDDA